MPITRSETAAELRGGAGVDAESRALSAHKAAETVTCGILESVTGPTRLRAQFTSQLGNYLNDWAKCLEPEA